ncbi:kinase-like domain-containing protein [Leucosporidium creatinivorum]|uniref:cyclin-dependent kinase n=1 Tax=Leucosporidium creatinivorum TaxID=106004 RepID=A0A1Y2F147_9BASI|nr:kinase-like domain-containing protein [Leucosporidium creatinivorum]
MATPDYNLDSPTTLLAPGTLQGAPINLDPTSVVAPSREQGIYVGSLTVPLTDALLHGGEAGKVAIKSVEDGRVRLPRNVRREVRLLAGLQHDNILPLLNAYLTPPTSSAPIALFTLLTPLYPLALPTLLSTPSFTPTTAPSSSHFALLAHSFAHQLISAVAYLHSRDPPVAHRDIGPNNVIIGREGRIVLIDFGISLEVGEEKEGEMHFEIGTQPYRPPELIFASKTYDPLALDLWALGATLAEFFTPLEAPTRPSPPSSPPSDRNGRWADDMSDDEEEFDSAPGRQTLFDGSRTDFALTGSIFKLLGTPTLNTWPEAANLPSFGHFRFSPFPPEPLRQRLPNLPTSSAPSHPSPLDSDPSLRSPSSLPNSPLLGIIEGLLKISASQRMSAREALSDERWRDIEVLKPVDLGGSRATTGGDSVEGKTLGELLIDVVHL